MPNKKDILLTYDRIILTRSDYYYIMDHPILPLGKLYVPEGEGYYGITDRHHVFDSKLLKEVLGVCDFICDRNNFELLKTQDSINPEKAILLYFQHNGINKIVKEFTRVQFLVSTDSDSTRWKQPSDLVQGNDKIKYKYLKEYLRIHSKIYLNNDHKKPASFKSDFFNDLIENSLKFVENCKASILTCSDSLTTCLDSIFDSQKYTATTVSHFEACFKQ